MTNDELNALRALLREEINAAEYASEQRIGERLDRIEGRMEGIEGHLDGLEGRMDLLEAHVSLMAGGQRDLQTQVSKIEISLIEAISVLDLATKVNNDLQASQRTVEIRLEENLAGLRREVQKLTEVVHHFARRFIDLDQKTNDRITLHEKSPMSATHPFPQSAL
jgi:chromosome segregation ATPase